MITLLIKNIIKIPLDIFKGLFSTHSSSKTVLFQANKDLCTLVGSPDARSERGVGGTSQSFPQWYIRPLQCSMALKRTALTFQLCSNYIHVLGWASTTKQPIVFYELTTGTLSQPPVTWDLGCPQPSPPADPPLCIQSGPSSAMPWFSLFRHLAPFTCQTLLAQNRAPLPDSVFEG